MCRVCYGLSKMQCLWRDMSCGLLQLVVGAVPMCPPVSPHKGASIVQYPTHNVCIFGMETPLRGRSGGHADTAQTCWEWNVLAGLIVHQGADVLAVHHALEVAVDVHVEHIDGQVVFLAHGGGGEVHHF